MPAGQTQSTKSSRTDSRDGGNKRYLGFLVKGPFPKRSDLIHLLNRSTRKGEPLPWLSFYEDGMGVIKCTDKNRKLMMDILKRAGDIDSSINLVPVITSGSIGQVKERLRKEMGE